MVVADLPSSKGETVAKELGDNTAFVATDVSIQTKELASVCKQCW